MLYAYLFPFFFYLSLFSASTREAEFFSADHPAIRYTGRIDLHNPKEPVLVGSAATIEISFSGHECHMLLKKINPSGEHNWVSLELDGHYLGRLKLENDSLQSYPVLASKKRAKHILKIIKATEAQNGGIGFGGVECKSLMALPAEQKRSIEFIGNSITCGMGIEWKAVPCDSGLWYDQHNAYWAYGPRVARALNTRFMLSAVSGMGMYRNWNSPGPVMPDVYENLHLNKSDSLSWDFSRFRPDLVSICLGTNDFSEGDGINERLPFDSAQFVAKYISFVNTVYEKYPKAQICLLSSPMVAGEKGKLFINCLQAVQQHFNQQSDKKAIAVYDFTAFVPNGCGYHPDKADHQLIAESLLPFYRKVMGW